MTEAERRELRARIDGARRERIAFANEMRERDKEPRESFSVERYGRRRYVFKELRGLPPGRVV